MTTLPEKSKRLRTIYQAGFALLFSITGPAWAKTAPPPPATLWYGGPILTMAGDRPNMVDAVVERDGKIIYAGKVAQARKIAGTAAKEQNLGGATLLPGFVDAHSHFAMMMQVASGVDLQDPDHPISDIPSLIAALRTGIQARQIAPGGWVIAWQYDDAKLAEKRHITRADLDAAFPDHKIVLIHFTGHGLVTNSAAMAAAGITESTPNPPGGITLRDASGKLTGVFFENAAYPVYLKIPPLSPEQRRAALAEAQRRYASNGFTHAQEGAASLGDTEALLKAGAQGLIKLDLALLPTSQTLDHLLGRADVRFGSYQGRVKLAGIKFVLDGSPQARTGYFTRPYANGAPDGHHPWHGTPNMSQEAFNADAARAHSRGWQIFVHANGDAAIDMAIKGFDTLGLTKNADARPVVIHSQFQRPDQLAAYQRIGVGPAYFSNHTYYFADIHRSNFSADVVGFISPFASALKAGLHPSNHSDSPVTPLDPMTQLWSSMARQSKTGVVNGTDQRLTAWQGLHMLTTGPAWQVFEEKRKGQIKPGMLADFVILDKNPLTTPLESIRSIKIMRTVKEGQTIWSAGQ
jgi:predicted amidohydrolase YtcJ